MPKFRARPRRLLLVPSLLLLASLLSTATAHAKKVMVISAHPDDESMMAAGVIHSAILNGDEINVVVMTNGERQGGTSLGLTRIAETVNAMSVLGVNENNVILLGYGDGILSGAFRYPTITQTSAAGMNSTYGNRGLGRSDYHFYKFGVHGSYTGQTILQDLTSLFQTYAPDEIYTHNFYDAHSDHDTVNQFVIKAIYDMRRQGSSYAPAVFENIVHDQSFPTAYAPNANCNTTWPGFQFDPTQSFAPPTCLFTVSPLPPYRWSDITSIDVPADMRVANAATNVKMRAFNQYVSQANSTSWGGYTKSNEWFWRRDIGHNVAPLAQVTVSSETYLQFGVNAVDGTLAGDPRDNTKEWRAGTPNNGEWIKLTWQVAQTISQIILYDRPNLTDNILAGTLTFSDGSSIPVGALPTNGAGQVFTFSPKTVSWVMFTITNKTGYYTGLAEFEVYGTSGPQQQNNPPKIVSGPTATPSTINTAQTSQVSVSASDPDNDPLTYTWSATQGTMVGSGAAVIFQPPAVAVQTTATISVTVADNRGGTAVGSTTVTVSPLPVVTIVATDPIATEATPASDTGTFTVSRTGDLSSPLTVNYTISGTASSGDYTLAPVPPTVAILSNQASATITLTPIDDTIVESNETVILSLTPVAGVYTLGAASSATVTIVDNDVPQGPRLTESPTSAVPGAMLTATWSGVVNPTVRDWIGLYAVGSGDGAFQNWEYVSCSRGAGVTPQASGSCGIVAPSTLANGSYELRLFANDGYSRIAVSNAFDLAAATSTSSSNVAGLATVQVSSENTAGGQQGIKAIDGVIDGYPNNQTKEWVTAGQTNGAWIQLNWSAPQSIVKVVLFDRPNLVDNVLSGTLTFSDGSSIAVGTLPNNGSALPISFSTKTVNWVRFTVNTASGGNIGLAEFQVFVGP